MSQAIRDCTLKVPDELPMISYATLDLVALIKHYLDTDLGARRIDNYRTYNDQHLDLALSKVMLHNAGNCYPDDMTAELDIASVAFRNALQTKAWVDTPDEHGVIHNQCYGWKWRNAMHVIMRFGIVYVPQAYKLEEMLEVLSDDMHGYCSLSFNGDCFDPPPWSAYMTSFGKRVCVGGDTAVDTLRRAAYKWRVAPELHEMLTADPSDIPID